MSLVAVAAVLAAVPGARPAAATTVEVPGGQVEVSIDRTVGGGISDAEILEWVRMGAEAVTRYYGRFPVPRARVAVRVVEGRGARGGSAHPDASIRIAVGKRSDRETLARDWRMTHEMIHFGFPSVASRHHWIEEGSATYVEPVARARAGLLSPEEAWEGMVDGLPQGLPEAGDRGLDRTPTWGRTYWGGALFCLLADVEIRERTGNRKGLEHALRAIVAEGGDIGADWPIARAFAVGDRAVGVPVLSELYARMRDAPGDVDLEALWRRLGIRRGGDDGVTFDERAPLAAVRRAITGS